MASILPGYEYDIFISYRHKDNKYDGWVTEFVTNLKKELEATFKEDISIYFDSNPHDGLLETHDVDDSLKGKLKCLVFIPIVSQTYCDPKSFAWKNEFLAFKKLAGEELFGLKVKLANGNVASRILPICIHELDAADKQLVETELGGALRGIEFVYRSQGVVRPLKASEEDAKANLNHTFYRDQINKVARAIKELVTGIQNSNGSFIPVAKHKETIPVSARKKLSLVTAVLIILGVVGYALFYFTGIGSKFFQERDRSIAVLPFENMNKDSTQDYFSNGIAEDILNHLVKISDLEVKSRTSTLQYKGTTKTAPVIGDELGVSNIVEGSVRRVGNQVRIVVQLIDTKNDRHLWSETYDRDFKDVLSLQSEIAIEIARALEAKLTAGERENIAKEASTSVTAYDYYLKARQILNESNYNSLMGPERREMAKAMSLVNQALRLDAGFAKAFALKGNVWFLNRWFGFNQKIWSDSSIYFASKSIALDPSAPDGYLLRASVLGFIGKTGEARRDVQTAYKITPSDPAVQFDYGLQLLSENNEKGAELILKSIEGQFKMDDPQYYLQLTGIFDLLGDTTAAKKLLLKAQSLSPGDLAIAARVVGYTQNADRAIEELKKLKSDETAIVDGLGWTYYNKGEYAMAVASWGRYKEIEAKFEDTTQVLFFRARLAMAYIKLGDKKRADALIEEHHKIYSEILEKKRGMGTWGNMGGVYYDLAICEAYLGKYQLALQHLDSAVEKGFDLRYFYHNDPLLENLQHNDDYKKILKKVDDRHEFRKRAFSNALNRAQASKELKGLKEKMPL